jgi:hypothetical protein
MLTIILNIIMLELNAALRTKGLKVRNSMYLHTS